MPEQDYEYSAFISYRHKDKYDDKDVRAAIWLQKTLESYNAPRAWPFFTKPFPVPKDIKHSQYPRKFKRVFRDIEEMPAGADLDDQIKQALAKSKFLIVICSTRTPSSPWIPKEIEEFHRLGRSHRILVLHIDGMPGTADNFGQEASFPDILTWRPEQIKADGTIIWKQEGGTKTVAEPLAATISPVGGSSLKAKKKDAKLRFLAALYDKDLNAFTKRVEKMERQKRVSQAGILTVFLAGVIAGAGYLEQSNLDASARKCHEQMAHYDNPDIPKKFKDIRTLGSSLQSKTDQQINNALQDCKKAIKNAKNPTSYQKIIRLISGSFLYHNPKDDVQYLTYLKNRAHNALFPPFGG